MEEFGAFLLFCWIIFMFGGVCIICTYMVWDALKSIFKGEI